jgi:hypothetical protein
MQFSRFAENRSAAAKFICQGVETRQVAAQALGQDTAQKILLKRVQELLSSGLF